MEVGGSHELMNWTLKFLITLGTVVQLKSETWSFKDFEATEAGRSVCIKKVFVDTL